MARCGCASACSCAVTAGPGVDVAGTGNASNPYVVSAVPTVVDATDTNCIDTTITRTGSNTDADPYTFHVSSVPKIAPEPNGLSCTPTGMTVAPSTDAGNILSVGADGNLYVSGMGVGASVVDDGDGTTVTGTGPASDPYKVNINPGCGIALSGGKVVANTPNAWPYPCNVSSGTDVYCDPTTGGLKGDAPHKTLDMYQAGGPTTVDTTPTCASSGALTVQATSATLSFTNPSTCRSMALRVEIGGRIRLDANESVLAAGSSPATFNGVIEVSVNGGAFAFVRNDTFDRNSDLVTVTGHMETTPIRNIVLAPGATATFQARLAYTCPNGALEQTTYNIPSIYVDGRTI